MNVTRDKNLEEAVYKWCMNECSSGVEVRGVELHTAAKSLAKPLNIENIRASDGWLWRFRNRHGLGNRNLHNEGGSAETEDVGPFRLKFNDLINKGNMHLFQMYNAHETGVFWRSFPNNTQAFNQEAQTPDRKISKERFSALCCANADGTHRLNLAVVGRSSRPRVLKDCLRQLPVIIMLLSC
jgi:hypothetical protein